MPVALGCDGPVSAALKMTILELFTTPGPAGLMLSKAGGVPAGGVVWSRMMLWMPSGRAIQRPWVGQFPAGQELGGWTRPEAKRTSPASFMDQSVGTLKVSPAGAPGAASPW